MKNGGERRRFGTRHAMASRATVSNSPHALVEADLVLEFAVDGAAAPGNEASDLMKSW